MFFTYIFTDDDEDQAHSVSPLTDVSRSHMDEEEEEAADCTIVLTESAQEKFEEMMKYRLENDA